MKDKKKSYSRQKHRLAIIDLILSPAILFIFIALDVPTQFKNICMTISLNNYINLLVFSIIMGAAYMWAKFPTTIYSGFLLEHKFSLSNQTFKAWLLMEFKKTLVSFVIGIPIIFSLYAFIKHFPINWWLFTAILWFFLSIIIAKVAPVLIVPLFYKYSPIKNIRLKEKLTKLASSVGFKAQGVYELNLSKDTKKANAALVGLGKQKRIVLCDTLLESFTEDEIEVVMGHELGHHKLKHILKEMLLGGIFTLLTLFITNMLFLKLHPVFDLALLYDFDALILVYAIISIINIPILVLNNAYSRKLEKQADRFALELTNKKAAFISTMKKLAEQNLADLTPGKFYKIILYSHPPISERIAFGESFKGIPKKDR